MKMQQGDFKIDAAGQDGIADVRFIVIGAVKAATTWIQKQLQAHPALFMPDVEPHYFSTEFGRGASYYNDLFAPASADAILGEKSADYLAHPRAAERIARMYPNAKLIVQLRNPVDRAYSDYKMLYRRGTVRGEPEDYLLTPNCEQPRFLNDGLYARHLRHWQDLFPADNILCFLYEDVRQDPAGTLHQVCEHIGVELFYDPELGRSRENDSSEQFLPLPVRKALAPLKATVAPLRNNAWFRATRGLLARQIDYPALSPELRAHLTQFYAEDVGELAQMLNRDLSRWLPTELRSADADQNGFWTGGVV